MLSKIIKITCLLCIFFLGKGFSLEIGLYAKHETDNPIKRLQVFSERCSGCNYVLALLIENFTFENSYQVPNRNTSSDLIGTEAFAMLNSYRRKNRT